jgi:hypothetical protein
LTRHGLRACAIVLSLYPAFAAADFTVPAGAVISLDGASLDLGCTDLDVAGTLPLGSGVVLNGRNVTVDTNGVLDGGTGDIQLGGDWSDNGDFIASDGTVHFHDVCTPPSGKATISGNSAFANPPGSSSFKNARFVSSIGKNYVFAVGSVQSISGVLQITGTAANPIQFRSASAGQVAFIDLAASGTQEISHVGVTDVWATGQFLAPGQTNEGGGGNAKRWFGLATATDREVIPVPVLQPSLLGILAALLALATAMDLRRRRSSPAAGAKVQRLNAKRTRL